MGIFSGTRLKTFKHGGIHPPESKLTTNKQVIEIKIPDKVVIPLQQHTGKEAKPVVKKGDYVKTGQLIAEADGFISANIHSPVSGKVSKIDYEPDITGYKKMAITIETEGDEWVEDIDRSNELKTEISVN